MTIGTTPICMACAHYKPTEPTLTCDAFERIPMEIVLNAVDHRQPVEGDNGIQFEVIPGREARLQEILSFISWGEEAETAAPEATE